MRLRKSGAPGQVYRAPGSSSRHRRRRRRRSLEGPRCRTRSSTGSAHRCRRHYWHSPPGPLPFTLRSVAGHEGNGDEQCISEERGWHSWPTPSDPCGHGGRQVDFEKRLTTEQAAHPSRGTVCRSPGRDLRSGHSRRHFEVGRSSNEDDCLTRTALPLVSRLFTDGADPRG